MRDGSLSEDGATVSLGPSGDLDSFTLSRPLTVSTDTTVWQILAGDSQSSLSLYAVLETAGYSGRVLSVGDQLHVSLTVVTRYLNLTGGLGCWVLQWQHGC